MTWQDHLSPEAILVADDHEQRLQVLITDFYMPTSAAWI